MVLCIQRHAVNKLNPIKLIHRYFAFNVFLNQPVSNLCAFDLSTLLEPFFIVELMSSSRFMAASELISKLPQLFNSLAMLRTAIVDFTILHIQQPCHMFPCSMCFLQNICRENYMVVRVQTQSCIQSVHRKHIFIVYRVIDYKK